LSKVLSQIVDPWTSLIVVAHSTRDRTSRGSAEQEPPARRFRNETVPCDGSALVARVFPL
jgi:hypothetical protein